MIPDISHQTAISYKLIVSALNVSKITKKELQSALIKKY